MFLISLWYWLLKETSNKIDVKVENESVNKRDEKEETKGGE